MDKVELIDRYFEGSLSKEEILVVEELLRSDEEFKKEFEFHQSTKEAITQNKRLELKAVLMDLEQQIQVEEKNKIIPIWKFWIKIAASIVIIGALAYTFFQVLNTDDTKPSDTFLSYYDPYPNVVSPITRGEEINPADLEKSAFIAYESKNFQLADSLFTQVLPYHREYISFYKGISKFELGQYDSAAKYFDNYLYSDGTQLRDQAKWYMALSYLVKGDTLKGKEELIRLRKSSGYKLDEVERILLSLE